jgi:hypothetical protein
MIAIGYFNSSERRGLLVFQKTLQGFHALGGFDPRDDSRATSWPITVVHIGDDENCLQYAGWLHPTEVLERVMRIQEAQPNWTSVSTDHD